MTTADTLRAKPGIRGATIILRSGVYFDYLNPDPATIHETDIAAALGYTCRFGGQCTRYYSVAQHCVLVSHIVPPELQFAALMHDAAEAYIGDVVGPLKQLLPDYRIVEDRVEAAIAERFHLTLPWAAEIKHADLRLLRTEQRDLTAGPNDDWSGLDAYEPLPVPIDPWPANKAARRWLDRFVHLAWQR